MRGRGYEIRRAGWQASNISTGEANAFIFKNKLGMGSYSKQIFLSLRRVAQLKRILSFSKKEVKTCFHLIFMGGYPSFPGEVM